MELFTSLYVLLLGRFHPAAKATGFPAPFLVNFVESFVDFVELTTPHLTVSLGGVWFSLA